MYVGSIDFSRFSSVKIGGVCEVCFLESLNDASLVDSPFIVGGANNLLVSPNAKNLYKLDKKFSYIKSTYLQNVLECYPNSAKLDSSLEMDLNTQVLEVGAASSARALFKYAKEHNLGGFEILSHLPGSIGGVIKMNAGLKEYEIKDVLLGIITQEGFIPASKLDLQYRSSRINGTIFAGVFKKQPYFNTFLVESLKKLRTNQPKGASFGSCFKNPKGDFAGRLIECVGLRGRQIGNVGFSSRHANFLINYGGATFSEALALIHLAKCLVEQEFGIILEEEVIVCE